MQMIAIQDIQHQIDLSFKCHNPSFVYFKKVQFWKHSSENLYLRRLYDSDQFDILYFSKQKNIVLLYLKNLRRFACYDKSFDFVCPTHTYVDNFQ